MSVDIDFPVEEPRVNSRVVLEECASDRIWFARMGIPGVYRVDPRSNETFFFKVWSCFSEHSGRKVIRIYPVSYWIDGRCEDRADVPKNGARPPFLPAGILFGKFDYDRIPTEHAVDLKYWAEMMIEGIEEYDARVARRVKQRRG